MEISTYALFSHLLEDIGADAGKPAFASNPMEAARRSLQSSLLKKLSTGSTDMADSAALLKFLQTNFRCKNWSLQLNTSADEELWGEFKNSIYRFWFAKGFPLAYADTDLAPLTRGRVGPGVSVGTVGESFYSKLFNSRLSCTMSDLYQSYKGYISRFPYWREADDLRSQTVGDCDVVEGSRLSFVPKNNTISRCICVEPNLNMFFQLGLGDIMVSRLRSHYGIDLSVQQFNNRDLARIGSIYDSNVTIDLESASDSIAVNLCKEVLPKSLWDILSRYRCRSTRVPGLGIFELDMVSSMGNGFTFPLQTMLFCAMVEASYKCAEVHFPSSDNQKQWGVFGDDIIVPKGKIARNLLRLLSLANFIVNDDKSFYEGPFRESCGSDYFAGVDVRGVYLQRLKTPQDIFVAINRLNLFSARTGVRVPKTVGYLLSKVPRIFVPLYENEDAGVRVPSSCIRVGRGVAVDKNGSYAYKAYRPRLRRIRFNEDSIIIPKFLRKKGYFFNGPGAFTAFLQRSLDASGISLRLKSTSYSLTRCVSPNWDAYPETHPLSGWFPWRRLEDAVYLNICS